MYKIGERRHSGSPLTSGPCDKPTAGRLGLNYKVGTAGAELPYKAAIGFDDPRLGRPLPHWHAHNWPTNQQAKGTKKVGFLMGGQAVIWPK